MPERAESSAPTRGQGQRIACIGLGMMGGPIAANLAAAGYAVYGCDPQAEARLQLRQAGGQTAETPAQAAAGAQLAVIVVRDAAQAEAVLWGDTGVLAGLAPGAAIWLACTVGPTYARDVAQRLAGRGIGLLDGPVSGGVEAARAGRLTVLAGAAPAVLAAWMPALGACAVHVHPVGAAGAGSAVKMINQIMVASHIAVAAEALALGERAGMDLPALIQAVRDSSGNSVMFAKRAPRMVAGDHAPNASIGLFLKDLDIALQEGSAAAQAMPMAQAARHVYALAATQGLAAASDTILLDVYRRMTDAHAGPTGEKP